MVRETTRFEKTEKKGGKSHGSDDRNRGHYQHSTKAKGRPERDYISSDSEEPNDRTSASSARARKKKESSEHGRRKGERNHDRCDSFLKPEINVSHQSRDDHDFGVDGISYDRSHDLRGRRGRKHQPHENDRKEGGKFRDRRDAHEDTGRKPRPRDSESNRKRERERKAKGSIHISKLSRLLNLNIKSKKPLSLRDTAMRDSANANFATNFTRNVAGVRLLTEVMKTGPLAIILNRPKSHLASRQDELHICQLPTEM